VKRIAKRQKGKQIQLWFQDEARVGQKGRNAHVWFEKGVRPVMRTDKRFKSVYIYGAVRPGTDGAFALILPRADTEMMRLYLDTFAQSLPADVHVVLVLDKAGWHVTGVSGISYAGVRLNNAYSLAAWKRSVKRMANWLLAMLARTRNS
jgi:hypothetical protein